MDSGAVLSKIKKLRTYHKPIKGCKFKNVFKTETTIGDDAYILLENEENYDLNVCLDFKLDLYELQEPFEEDCAEFVLESGSHQLVKLVGKE